MFRVDTFIVTAAVNVDVYDMYAHTTEGHLLHFGVLLPSGNGEWTVDYAREQLQSIGMNVDSIRQNHYRFCHTGTASQVIKLQVEGCPPLPCNEN